MGSVTQRISFYLQIGNFNNESVYVNREKEYI